MAQSSGANRKVLVLAGDGIGPEIMREVMRLIEFFARRRIASFDVSEGLVGGAAYLLQRGRRSGASLSLAPPFGSEHQPLSSFQEEEQR